MTPDALATLHAHLLTALATPPTETRRLFHGRGRCWPGLEQLTVDWLQGVLLVSLFKEPDAAALEALKQLLQTHFGSYTVALQHRYLPQSTTEWLAGSPVDALTITEGGLRYLIDLGKKQNSGLFLDMRYGRNWVREQAKGQREQASGVLPAEAWRAQKLLHHHWRPVELGTTLIANQIDGALGIPLEHQHQAPPHSQCRQELRMQTAHMEQWNRRQRSGRKAAVLEATYRVEATGIVVFIKRQAFGRTITITMRLHTELGYGDGYGSTEGLPFYENYYAGGFNSVRDRKSVV